MRAQMEVAGAWSALRSGLPVPALASGEFVESVSQRFELVKGRSHEGWLVPERLPELLAFADEVAAAYEAALVQATLDEV